MAQRATLRLALLTLLGAAVAGAIEAPVPNITGTASGSGYYVGCKVSIDLGTGFIPTAVTKEQGDYEIRCSFVDGSTCVGRTLRMPAGQGEGCRDATTGLPLMYGLEAALPVELVEDGPVAINPLTTMQAVLYQATGNTEWDELGQMLAEQMGIPSAEAAFTGDFMEGAINGSAPALKALGASMQLQNIILIGASTLAGTLPPDVPFDPDTLADAVYFALGLKMAVAAKEGGKIDLTDPAFIADVLTMAQDSLNKVLTDAQTAALAAASAANSDAIAGSLEAEEGSRRRRLLAAVGEAVATRSSKPKGDDDINWEEVNELFGIADTSKGGKKGSPSAAPAEAPAPSPAELEVLSISHELGQGIVGPEHPLVAPPPLNDDEEILTWMEVDSLAANGTSGEEAGAPEGQPLPAAGASPAPGPELAAASLPSRLLVLQEDDDVRVGAQGVAPGPAPGEGDELQWEEVDGSASAAAPSTAPAPEALPLPASSPAPAPEPQRAASSSGEEEEQEGSPAPSPSEPLTEEDLEWTQVDSLAPAAAPDAAPAAVPAASPEADAEVGASSLDELAPSLAPSPEQQPQSEDEVTWEAVDGLVLAPSAAANLSDSLAPGGNGTDYQEEGEASQGSSGGSVSASSIALGPTGNWTGVGAGEEGGNATAAGAPAPAPPQTDRGVALEAEWPDLAAQYGTLGVVSVPIAILNEFVVQAVDEGLASGAEAERVVNVLARIAATAQMDVAPSGRQLGEGYLEANEFKSYDIEGLVQLIQSVQLD